VGGIAALALLPDGDSSGTHQTASPAGVSQKARTPPPPGDPRDANLTPQQLATREARRASTGLEFEKNGVKPGEPVPDLQVVRLDGSPAPLSQLWQEKPTLLVTASLTCGRSRVRQPWVEELAAKYRDRINVAVLYTIEAHPVVDPSPYAAYSPELENAENPGERAGGNRGADGYERRQPTDLEGRRLLAEEFKDVVRVEVPIVVDDMSNEAWKTLGGGPNMGLLIGRDGKLVVKQAWFVGEKMDRSIAEHLDSNQG
jgi:hypothetical protein